MAFTTSASPTPAALRAARSVGRHLTYVQMTEEFVKNLALRIDDASGLPELVDACEELMKIQGDLKAIRQSGPAERISEALARIDSALKKVKEGN